ncbi:MAG: nucleotidyltransferase family protein [Roseibacillus sp.]
MKIAAVILAAGSSRRFGQPKALLEWQGETLLQRTCRIALESGHSPILVVTQPNSDVEIPDYAQALRNPKHHEGMGTSLALAAEFLKSTDTDAFTILFPDQPAITADNLLQLQSQLSPPQTTIVLSDSGQFLGPPSVFARDHFSALSELTGDQGGKNLAKDFPTQTQSVSNPEALWDIDTPEIWKKFKVSQSNFP